MVSFIAANEENLKKLKFSIFHFFYKKLVKIYLNWLKLGKNNTKG